MRWTIEQVEVVKDDMEAAQVLTSLAQQQGYLGGRVLPWSPEKPKWRVQAFFENDGITSGWLPDGCHYRMTPASLLNARKEIVYFIVES